MITCDEYRRLTATDPLNATRADRAAANKHFANCTSCRTYMHKYMDELLPKMQEEDPEALAAALKHAHEIAKDDMTDPEFVDVACKISPERARELLEEAIAGGGATADYVKNEIMRRSGGRFENAEDALAAIAQELTKQHFGNELGIGKYFIYRENGTGPGVAIVITEGTFLSGGRLSNFWYWRTINPDGSRGEKGGGYGASEPHFTKVTREAALEHARRQAN